MRTRTRSRAVGALAAAFALGALLAPAAAAQETDTTGVADPRPPEGENLQVPDGWQFRLDSPDPDAELVAAEEPEGPDVRFVHMRPGWHVTTGPRVILWPRGSRAAGDYRASVTTRLFDPGRRNEAYGLFVGGRDLQGPDQRYLYFLVRRSGDFLVKLREGSGTRELVGWTSHDAVVAWDERDGETATNTLSVEARGDSLHFSVNGARVTSLARDGLPTEGIVGWRVNHRLNLHFSDFHVEDLDG